MGSFCAHGQFINTAKVFYGPNTSRPFWTLTAPILIDGQEIIKEAEIFDNRGFSTGILFEKHSKKNRLIFTSGIYYTLRKWGYTVGSQFDDNGTPIYFNTSLIEEYHEIEVPFLAGLRWEINKFSIYPYGGISAGFRIKDMTTTISYLETGDTISEYENTYKIEGPERLNIILGLGAEYKIKDHWLIFIEPDFKVNISTNPNYSYERTLKTLTLKFGIGYKF